MRFDCALFAAVCLLITYPTASFTQTHGLLSPLCSSKSCAVATPHAPNTLFVVADNSGAILRPQPLPSRHHLLCEASPRLGRRTAVVSAVGTYLIACGYTAPASAYMVERVEPDEREIYAEALSGGDGGRRPLRVLWVGAGSLRGVFKGLFPEKISVTAVDLVKPSRDDLQAATTYAAEHGFVLNFEQGDARALRFQDSSFDAVLSSQFLCQDFGPGGPEVAVKEIRRVLRPGGRFGFWEDEDKVDAIVVRAFGGDQSVIRVQFYPEKFNIVGGVVVR